MPRGSVVIGDGDGTLDGVAVEHANVWLNGAASRSAVDNATGRLVQLAFHGRDASMKVGDSVRRFTTCATVDGVTLPTTYTVVLDGKEPAGAPATVDTFEVSPALDAELFEVGSG